MSPLPQHRARRSRCFSKCIHALRRAGEVFVRCRNGRQCHKQRRPRYPSNVIDFVSCVIQSLPPADTVSFDVMSAMLLALAALFMWSFLAATILPLGSEAPLAVYVRSYGQLAVPVLVATAGNYLGACTTYWLGRRAAQALGRGREVAGGETRSARLLRRFGPPALLLSWVPILGDALVALAGAVRMPFGAFSFWAAAGKALRYAAVAWAASAVWREAG